jgi:hypothetical protein
MVTIQESYNVLSAERVMRIVRKLSHASIWLDIQTLAGHYSKEVFDLCAVTLASASIAVIVNNPQP